MHKSMARGSDGSLLSVARRQLDNGETRVFRALLQ